MSEIYTSFAELTVDDFSDYASTLVKRYPNSEQRKQAVSYLQNVNSADKISLDTERDNLRTKRVARKKRQGIIDQLLADLNFDFAKQPALFQAQVVSDNDILTLLTQANKEVFISRNITADVTISGDGVLFDGGSNELAAVDDLLVNQSTVTGLLKINGDDIKIRGVNFITTGEKALEIIGNTSNLTLENCTFTGPSGHTSSSWFYGNDGFYSGNLTIKNCKVTGFTGVLLADWSTSSATATSALKRVRIRNNYFKDNL